MSIRWRKKCIVPPRVGSAVARGELMARATQKASKRRSKKVVSKSVVKRAFGPRPGKVAMLRQVVSGPPEWSDWAA